MINSIVKRHDRLNPFSDAQINVIRAATKLFLQNGYTKTTFKMIEIDSGVKVGNITYYFHSKEELLKVLIEELMDFHATMLEEIQITDEGVVHELGTTVLELYYDRNTYNVSYEYEGTVPAGADAAPTDATDYRHGQEVTILGEPGAVSGYTFSGWHIHDAGITVSGNVFEMPTRNVVIYGRFTPNTNTPYIIHHYLENLDGTYPSIAHEAEIRHATTGDLATVYAKKYVGYEIDRDTTTEEDVSGDYTTITKTISNLGDTTFNFYYKLRSHNVEYVYDGLYPQEAAGLKPATQENVFYGTRVNVAPAPFVPGYTFTGWTTSDAKIVDGKFAMPNHDVVFLGRFVQQAKVSYDLNGGTDAEGVDYTTKKYEVGTNITVNAAPSRSGYTFKGWKEGDNTFNPADEVTVDHNLTFVAQWSKNGGGGGGGAVGYSLTYETNGGNYIPREYYSYGKTVTLIKVPVKEGYVFEGWHIDKELKEDVKEVKMDKNITVYASWVKDNGSAGHGHDVPGSLNGEDHFAYVVGYPDGTVRPNDKISRAEVTTIFFRLLKPDEVRDKNLTSENSFEDIKKGDWHNTPISTMFKLGIVKGRTEDRFVPDAFITRAEFAAICARFDNSEFEITDNFKDINGHWAEADIHEAAAHGWIRGYEDGTFKPDKLITRAEAMTMINRVLNRVPETADDLLADMIQWPDNKDKSAWYYLAVQEATNSHDYKMKNNIYEKWTSLGEVTDWTKYE